MPSQNLNDYLEHITANQPLMLEYFINEILNAQPEPIQDFLLRTSLVERLSPALGQAITGRADSAQLLQAIGRSNLFLEWWDETGQWYQYHALFSEAMQREAERRLSAAEIKQVLERAKQWYLAQDMIQQAIETTLRMKDYAIAISLINQFMAIHKLTSEDFLTLRGWAEQLPVELLDQEPDLRLQYAMGLLAVAMITPASSILTNQINHSLQVAEDGFQATNNVTKLGEVMAFRALLASQDANRKTSVEFATKALAWLPPEELPWRSWSLGLLGMEAFMAGDVREAKAKLLEARAIGQLEGNPTYLRANAGMLSGVYGASGELYQAEAYITQVLEEARTDNDQDDIAHGQIGLAILAYEWNELKTAQVRAQEACEIAQSFKQSDSEVEAVLILAKIDQAEGKLDTALTRLTNLLIRLQPQATPLLLRLHAKIRLAQAQIYLLQGNLHLVEQWQQARSLDMGYNRSRTRRRRNADSSTAISAT